MNPDHNAVDRVLNALRNSTPPTGMERRILNVLEDEACRPTQPTRFRLGNMWMTATACGAALVVAVLIGAFTIRRHNPSVVSTMPIPQTQPSNISRSSVATTPERTEAATAPRPRSAAPQRLAQPRRVEVAQSEEKQVGHPAPPIPLTDQERILLRYARRGNTGDLAQISNENKSAREDQEKQEFQAFFEPPRIKIGESE